MLTVSCDIYNVFRAWIIGKLLEFPDVDKLDSNLYIYLKEKSTFLLMSHDNNAYGQ